MVANSDQGPAAVEVPACIHYWVLSEPVAGTINGRCKRCGTDRVFPASPEGAQRFDDYRELTQSAAYYGARTPA